MAASGITGFITYRVTNRQVASSEQMAREARHQERLETAYTSLMRFAAEWSDWVEATTIQVRSAPPPPEPAPIDPAEHAFASITSSSDVADLTARFTQSLKDFRFRWNALLVAEERDDTPTALRRSDEAKEAAKTVQLAGDDLVDKMREELGAVGQLPRTPA